MPISILPTSVTYKTLRRLTTPQKIQDFLNAMPFNFEKNGETYMSVERSLEAGKSHCFEGALIAAAALQMHGEKPLLLDLKARGDVDHVVALFSKRFGKKKYWGAISKTNHAVLRYREPVYASVRELAMSYFHEYFLDNGTKTLTSYSKPFDLTKTKIDWLSSPDSLFGLVDELDHSPHTSIVPKGVKPRRADPVEIKAGKITEYKP